MRQRLLLTNDESIVLFLGVSCALFLVVCLRRMSVMGLQLAT